MQVDHATLVERLMTRLCLGCFEARPLEGDRCAACRPLGIRRVHEVVVELECTSSRSVGEEFEELRAERRALKESA